MVPYLCLCKNSENRINRVYPSINVAELRGDLLNKARKLARINFDHHPWAEMSNEEMLASSGLILKDSESGKRGLTLASILLFGTDELIASVLPQYKTEAIVRIIDKEHFDERVIVATNLIESYERLMDFGKRFLTDNFVLDGSQRISAVTGILREIIVNLLIHRDFSSGFVAKIVIEKNRLFTENANLTHYPGKLDAFNFTPFSKNPAIAKVFRNIGYADELGSGVKNTYKFTRLYSGAEPSFFENDVFRTEVPLKDFATMLKIATVLNGDGKRSAVCTGDTIKPAVGSNDTINDTIKPAVGSNDTINDTIKPAVGSNDTINDTIKPAVGSNDTINDTIKSDSTDVAAAHVLPSVKLSEIELRILELVRENSAITRDEISGRLALSSATVGRAVGKLKSLGLIRREGSRKTGHWTVLF